MNTAGDREDSRTFADMLTNKKYKEKKYAGWHVNDAAINIINAGLATTAS